MRLSISKIKAFKSCRKLYQFQYLEELEPVQKSEALRLGSNYHELLEIINTQGDLTSVEEDYSVEQAMATAYMKYIYPHFKVVAAEKWLTYDLGNGDTLVGIVDGIAADGHIVEHKSYGSEITEQYEYNLQWDEQILAYMLMTGMRSVWYTICRKPTIRQGKNETDEEFFKRMVTWYDEDTDKKIRLLEITRTDEEVNEFKDELFRMLDEMKNATHFYRNTCHCNMWGRRCEYSSICLNYDPNQEYLEFVKRETKNGTETN